MNRFLNLRGDFLFYCTIIVQGEFETQGSGNRIFGAAMAPNSADIDHDVSGDPEITYSRCAITPSILNNASPSRVGPLARRSWVDLKAVTN